MYLFLPVLVLSSAFVYLCLLWLLLYLVPTFSTEPSFILSFSPLRHRLPLHVAMYSVWVVGSSDEGRRRLTKMEHTLQAGH